MKDSQTDRFHERRLWQPGQFLPAVKVLIPIAFSKSLSCRQLCLGIITMHYLEQMSRRPQLPEGFNDVDF
ncbi:hypothetical protein, partial [Endozoicomonas atrinae]|uniref:hypothetical protein n=1 Tax=Endozoicomonas atrinae TaxID=1333660 RepID=UPI001EE6D82E